MRLYTEAGRMIKIIRPFLNRLNEQNTMQKEFNKCKYYTVSPSLPATNPVRAINLDQNSPLNTAHVVSIRTRRSGTNVRTLQGKEIVSDAAFDAAFLVLKMDTQTEVMRVPLAHIEKATLTDPAQGFPVYAKGLNWNTCQVEVVEGVSLTAEAGKAFEFTLEYFELKK